MRKWNLMRLTVLLIAGCAVLLAAAPASAQGVLFVKAGRVGIGNDNPLADLHIKNETGAKLWFSSSSLGTWALNPAGQGFLFSKQGTGVAELKLTAAGDLEIAGDYSSNCASGCTPVPDYVFQPDYELMSLSDLQDFIARENHLPNIPSADEMQGQVNFSQLQMKMLEKIEELTLYTLQQQSTIEHLQARLDALAN
jgi:hypothetical protein